MTALKIALIVIIAYIAFRMILFFILYRKVFINEAKGLESLYDIPNREIYNNNADKIRALVDSFKDLEYEEVQTLSFDNLLLKGRLYEGNKKAPVIICFHGYKSAALRDAGLSIRLRDELGFNVIVVDQRAHGKSGGKALSFGANEKRDALSWCEYAKGRFGRTVQIGLCGLSMGATTVILAAGMEVAPRNIKGVVADCPFSSAKEIIQIVIKSLHAPVGISYLGVSHAGMTYGRINLKEADANEAVKRLKAPVLLFHGEDDAFVPCWMSENLHKANPKMIRFFPVKGADHGLSYILEPEKYQNEVAKFWKENFDLSYLEN